MGYKVLMIECVVINNSCHLRVRWRSNQSILKEINPEYPLEGLMLKLKLQYFGHLMQRAYSLEKTLVLGKIKGRRRREGEMVGWHHQLNKHEFEQDPGDVKDREAWYAAVCGVAKSQMQLSD